MNGIAMCGGKIYGIEGIQSRYQLIRVMTKDELTWKDVRRIANILEKMVDEEILGELNIEDGEQPYYEEVLRRFNKQ